MYITKSMLWSCIRAGMVIVILSSLILTLYIVTSRAEPMTRIYNAPVSGLSDDDEANMSSVTYDRRPRTLYGQILSDRSAIAGVRTPVIRWDMSRTWWNGDKLASCDECPTPVLCPDCYR